MDPVIDGVENEVSKYNIFITAYYAKIAKLWEQIAPLNEVLVSQNYFHNFLI